MRHETRQTERRAPIVPDDAGRLVERGVTVSVEESAQRVFPTEEYAAAGCRIVPAGSWAGADADEIIVGLKELPSLPAALVHRHVYFGHAYKHQEGARDLLGRFAAGGGLLLDIEHLVDSDDRRLASFGYWAGYVGAALAMLHFRGLLDAPLRPHDKEDLDRALRAQSADPAARVLVIGALGRCGQGAVDALAGAGLNATCWDLAETRVLDRAVLLAHDIVVNTVRITRPSLPFLTHADLELPDRRLSVICDVTCDVTSACNMLPIYERVTTWPEPVLRLRGGERPLDIIAIDNLPSLLPKEASVAFSAELSPLLLDVNSLGSLMWRRCAGAFANARRSTGLGKEAADA
jgi:saccharopine dehydrogenase (NAD+, L-lysine-forming)